MKLDDIDTLFNDLQSEFDLETPADNHEKRFLNKLNKQNQKKPTKGKLVKLWLPVISIAASIVLLVTMVLGGNAQSQVSGLASVSPEMAKTESFFTSTIASELKKLETESNPKTTLLINDALKQLKRLETEYELLKTDLSQSGNDQRVIYAMISNFQNRIEVLENTLKQIEHLKELNSSILENTL
ncbi:hypothetical protein ACW5R3_07055 [Bizionia sp. KMM 8389]